MGKLLYKRKYGLSGKVKKSLYCNYDTCVNKLIGGKSCYSPFLLDQHFSKGNQKHKDHRTEVLLSCYVY